MSRHPTPQATRSNSSLRFALRPTAIAVHLLLAGVAVGGWVGAAQAQTATAASTRSYNIPAGPLNVVLTRFLGESGVLLSGSTEQAQGKQSRGVQGNLTPDAALAALLAGTGLQAVADAQGRYVLRVAPTAPAARPQSEATLSVVRVTASAERGLVTEGTASYTSGMVSIGKGAQSLREMPQSVSVLTRARMDDQALLDVGDAVRRVTGGVLVDYGPGSPGISLRGYELDSISLDGLSTLHGLGTHGVGAPDLALFDRVEVLRGPAAFLQGAGEPGGSVNLVRKRARAEPSATVRYVANSWPGHRVEFDATGALSEDERLRGRVALVKEKSDSYIDDLDSDENAFYGTLEYRAGANTNLSFGVTHQSADAVPYVGIPTYADGRFADISRSFNFGAPWNEKDDRSNRVFFEMEHALDDGGEARVYLHRTNRRVDYQLNYTTSTINGAGFVNRWALRHQGEQDEWGYDAYIDKPFELAGRKHRLLVGTDGRKLDRSSAYDIDFAYEPINVFDPDSATNPPPNYTPYSVSENESKERGLYGRATLEVMDATRVVLGGRLTNWKAKGSSDAKVSNELTTYAAVIHDLTPSTSAYFSAVEIFKPQESQTVGGGYVEPRTGEQFELGVKGDLMHGRANWHIAAFRMTDENRAISDLANPGFSVADGRNRSEGFEAEISGELLDRFDLFAGYAYTKTKQLKAASAAVEGQPFSPGTPEHSLKTWGQYRFDDRWTAGLGLEYSSGVYAQSGNVRWEQDSYWVTSARVAYRIDDTFTVSLNGNNLTDEHYYSRVQGGSRQTYFGAPRHFLLTLESKF